MPQIPLYHQDTWRARTNVTDPTDQDAAFDAGDVAAATDWTQDVGQLIRCRFLIQQTEVLYENHADGQTEFRLQYENATQVTGWVTVGAQGTSAEDVVFAAGAAADNSVTNAALLGAGTPVDGEYIEDQDTGTITFTELALTETEIEVAIQIIEAQVDDADLINLRFLHSAADETPPGTVLNDYTNGVPQMTVNIPAAPPLPPGLGGSMAEQGRSQGFPMTSFIRLPSGLYTRHEQAGAAA